jgi:selenocysteine lyase/cysteine desulfurase
VTTARGAGDLVLPSQRGLFSLPDEVVYLNTANMSLLLHSVREAGERALARRAAPWQISAGDWFSDVELLRGRFAELAGVDLEGVALVPATSYGLAVAARNLAAAAGDRVLVLADEYPSNYYTWRRFCERTLAELVVVERERGQSWTEAVLSRVDEQTRVVAVPNVHWTNGSKLDLVAVGHAARDAGAALVIDASQSLGAMPLDVSAIRPDFVVTVGYKWLLGPLGLGFLYVGEQHRDGEPLEENWINRAGSEDFTALVDYDDAYRPGARRFDVGQRTNFGLVPMAIAALQQLLEWTVGGVAASLRGVTDEIAARAGRLGFDVAPEDQRGPHMLGIDVPRGRAQALASDLADRGIVASIRGSSLRVAPHLHTTPSDIDRLLDALGQLADATG